MLMKELREIMGDSFMLFFGVMLYMLSACFIIVLFWLCVVIPVQLGGKYLFLYFLTIPLLFVVCAKLEEYAGR